MSKNPGPAYPFLWCMVKQAVIIVAALLLFLGGLASGHFAMTTWPGAYALLGSSEPLNVIVLDKLKSELRLAPDQVTRIAPVIGAACANLRLVSEERRAERLALLDEVASTIAPILSSDQQRRLEALDTELQKRPNPKRDQLIVALY